MVNVNHPVPVPEETTKSLREQLHSRQESIKDLRKEMKDIEAENDFLDKIVNNVEGVIFINRLNDEKKHERVWHNARAKEIFNVPDFRSDELENHYRETWAPEHMELFEDIKKRNIEDDDSSYSMVYRKKVRGEWKWIYIVGKILSYKENGDYDEYLGIGVDLTERIDTDKQLRELLNENLILRNQVEIGRLTSREKEVLARIGRGKTNKQIANDLQVSPHTISTHRKNLLKKLNLRNTAELIHFTTECGII